ncbi:CDP-diacylglycerol--glycerol-3-phosphate 3-phosphatidyltransferase [Synechocystis sp. PCC 7339]|uniref:CDP-diacylglycerol--glycerol-3-phosphate 3-phosphatidyltransferase n=1 Tax=unclassified Synechocystis TaxID=2640012 RepID=UPI001BAFEB80|nr:MULTISPECIES: CDP-diacylglycerol--glycerol-3-phosphate 3-phosphatidyltransferase [unclassified Synechocystis]QUS62017.1 CDP-diacylglycerol--glycerol-3-phosphate 3-phosphatidyltransferase [Synechocystis sp. PCC 7338]UAJ74216.1 CDP-diacylglycerol--glycerol-3-phosphate 3-phosphatidyltransferase [Synechocystis sp. PCC 7339]
MNVPNWVTVSRLLALPLLFLCLPTPDAENRWWGVGIFLLAASTDWLDGYLARRLNQVTELGKFLDPLVDKLMVLGPLLILLTWQMVPAWAVGLILARELVVAGWRVNPQLASQGAITGANVWGKAKTATQIMAIALLLAPLPEIYGQIGMAIFWIAVVLTLISGAIYLFPPINNKVEAS